MLAEDDVVLTIFECQRWDNVTLPLSQFCRGRNPTSDDVQDLICGPVLTPGIGEQRVVELMDATSRAKSAFVDMVHLIMKTKEEDERLLQSQLANRGA